MSRPRSRSFGKAPTSRSSRWRPDGCFTRRPRRRRTTSSKAGSWVRALRCAACHDMPGTSAPLPAPALDRLAGNLSRGWIVERLAETAEADSGEVGSSRRMPHFALTRAEAQAVADYLFGALRKGADRTVQSKSRVEERRRQGRQIRRSASSDRKAARAKRGGRRRFVSRLGLSGLPPRGPVGKRWTVRRRRSVDGRRQAAGRFLCPLAGRSGRDQSRSSHAGVRAQCVRDSELVTVPEYAGKSGGGRRGDTSGKTWIAAPSWCKIFAAARATPCRGPATKRRQRLPLDTAALTLRRDEANCFAAADRGKNRPGYRLDESAHRATNVYLAASARVKDFIPTDGRESLVERNCLACHARDRSPGLAEILPAIADADPSLGDSLAALVPPALTGVGDKLIDDALAASITASQPPRQSWLRVRMPRFPLSADETQKLVRYFVEADRMPDRPGATEKVPVASDATLEGAGARLVTADGFGCTSCHAIGNWKPQQVAPTAARRRFVAAWPPGAARVVRSLRAQSGASRAADGDARHRAADPRRARGASSNRRSRPSGRCSIARAFRPPAPTRCAWRGARTCPS